MESEKTFGVERRYPDTRGSGCGKEKMKEEVVGLGVELSVCIAEAMFLLRDDIVTMLCFCRRLLRYAVPPTSPVLQRLLPVIHSVYTQHIEPKIHQGDGGNMSANWELIKTTWNNFTDGVIVLHRLVVLLESKDKELFDDRLLSRAIAKYKQQVLNEIRDTLRDVSEGNGFAREMMESNVWGSGLWQSLFDEGAGDVTPEKMMHEIARKLFHPLVRKSLHSEIKSLPIYSPYILGLGFAREEMKEEAMELGVELSLQVAESMFLVCDDVRSVLRFCLFLWKKSVKDLKPASPVGERLLRVMYYVYTAHIKPKNLVYQRDGESVHWDLVLSTLESFRAAIRDLNRLVSDLMCLGNVSNDRRELACRVEEAMKKVDEKLRDVKDIPMANGFSRDGATMKPKVLELWKALCEDTEEPWARKFMKQDMLSELFPNVSSVHDTT